MSPNSPARQHPGHRRPDQTPSAPTPRPSTRPASQGKWKGGGGYYKVRMNEMFYLTTLSTDFIYGYMASDIWLRTILIVRKERKGKYMLYLMTHSIHFVYDYMASDIWLRTILIMIKETRCRKMGYSFRLTARVILYAPSHRQDST